MKSLIFLLSFPLFIASVNVAAQDEDPEETAQDAAGEVAEQKPAATAEEAEEKKGPTEYEVDLTGVKTFAQITKFKQRLQGKLGKRSILHESDVARGNVKLKLVTDVSPDLVTDFVREVMKSSDEVHAENLVVEGYKISLNFTE